MKPNALDRVIGWVAPEAGARRLKNRNIMEIMGRGYNAASPSRSRSSWQTPSTSADTEVGAAGKQLRNQMRDLVRNNPHAANAISVLVSHAIGDGIVPRAKDKKVNELFKAWVDQCDADGQLDFYGIQGLAVRGMLESGDGIVRKRIRKAKDGLKIPLQLQVMETDMIDASKHGALANGNRAVQGIELNSIGKRRSYWMFDDHPGDNYVLSANNYKSSAIPADSIAHVYEKQRTQIRGTPWGTPAIDAVFSLTEYEVAEITRKRIEACSVGVVTAGEDDGLGMPTATDGEENSTGVYDADGAIVERFEPGMFLHVRGGKDIKFSQPSSTGGYDAYKDSMLHTIAAGFRVPHSLLSGRLDKVNYSSSKVGLQHFHKTMSALQWQFIIPMLCQPMWDWFIEAAYLAGEIDSMNHPVTWTPPKRYSADPGRDAAAALLEMRAGIKTLPETVSETGRGFEEVMQEHKESQETLDRLGLVFTSDPRHFSDAGQIHQASSDDDPPTIKE